MARRRAKFALLRSGFLVIEFRLPWAAQNPIFKRLAEVAEIGELSAEERLKYDAAIQWYRDNAFLLEGAEEVGLQKGLKKGRAEGRKEGMVANAHKMKAYGLALEMIADITGLTIDEVRDL